MGCISPPTDTHRGSHVHVHTVMYIHVNTQTSVCTHPHTQTQTHTLSDSTISSTWHESKHNLILQGVWLALLAHSLLEHALPLCS